jgi:hypothetical protein
MNFYKLLCEIQAAFAPVDQTKKLKRDDEQK